MVRVRKNYNFKDLIKYGFKKICKERYIYNISDINSIIISTVDDQYMKKGQICFSEYINPGISYISPRDKITNLDVIFKMINEGVLEYYDDTTEQNNCNKS